MISVPLSSHETTRVYASVPDYFTHGKTVKYRLQSFNDGGRLLESYTWRSHEGAYNNIGLWVDKTCIWRGVTRGRGHAPKSPNEWILYGKLGKNWLCLEFLPQPSNEWFFFTFWERRLRKRSSTFWRKKCTLAASVPQCKILATPLCICHRYICIFITKQQAI